MSVSIAMCTYQGEKYIKEQLESIIYQTVKPNEIVICDDCSTDSTLKLAVEILEKSTVDYCIIRNEKRLGAVKNFEQCILRCKGDIIFFCDQDDYWKANKIECFLSIFKNPEVVYCYSDGQVIDKFGNLITDSLWDSTTRKKIVRNQEEFLADALEGRFPHGCTVAARRKFCHEISPYYLLHDNWCAITAIFYGKVAGIPDTLMEYRQHDTNASGTDITKKKKSRVTKIKKIMHRINSADLQEYFGWPHTTYKAWKEYYDRWGDNLSKNMRKNLCKKLQVLEMLKDIGSSTWLEIVKKLWKNRDLYYQTRGNVKMLLLDCLVLLIKRRECNGEDKH